jgi:enamine deaminase RidA (YjgF/YER057c/UK114 family)
VDAIEGPVSAQTWGVYRNLRRVLEAQGSTLGQILRFHIYQKDKRFFPAFERVRIQYEPQAPAPSSGLGISRLQRSADAWIDMDGIALLPAGPLPAREVLTAPGVLPSASVYSQGVRSGPYLFLAGHIPIDTARPGKPVVRGYDDVPEAGRFLQTGRSHPDSREGPIAAQAWFTYQEIGKLLEGQGASLRDIVNLTVFLQDMRDLPTFHRVHARLFTEDPPALTVTEFAEVGHRGTLIEIEATAVLPGHGVVRRTLSGPARPGLHAASGLEAGPLVFLSGACGWGMHGPAAGPADLPAEGREAVERHGGDRPAAAAQAWAALAQVRDTLGSAGLSLRDVCKVTVYLKDLADFSAFDAMRKALVPGERPALALVQIPRPGPTDAVRLCVEAIACRG